MCLDWEFDLQLDLDAERVVAERAVEHRLESGLGLRSFDLLTSLLGHRGDCLVVVGY